MEKVRPGLWSIPVPLPNNSLRYVLIYLFETDRGPYLIDAGWNTDDAFSALSDGIAEAGSNIGDVQRGASETGSASSQVLSAAKSLSGDSNRLKLEVGKFLSSVRAA